MTEHPSFKQSNFLNTVFPKPPYHCVSRQSNPELGSLESVIYQEDYTRTTCDSCECNLESFSREIENEFDDNWETETICKNDYLKLPKQPIRLEQLRIEIGKCKKQEYELGIYHHLMTYDYNSSAMCEVIPVPKLEARIPKKLE